MPVPRFLYSTSTPCTSISLLAPCSLSASTVSHTSCTWVSDGRRDRGERGAALVDAGVSAASPDQWGLNALHAAALNRHADAVNWLRQRDVPVPHPLTQVLLGASPLQALSIPHT